MEKEIWKTVIIDGVDNPRYKVSSFGRVICLNWCRTGKPRLCGLSKISDGYLTVSIDGVTKRVHRIVAETFIPNPEAKPYVDHIDTNRQNNMVDNIRWTTRLENNNNPLTKKHLSENHWCRNKFGADNYKSIPIIQLTLDGKFIRKWSCAAEVERELGIANQNIAACCRGKQKTAGGYRWVYASEYKPPVRYISDIKALF